MYLNVSQVMLVVFDIRVYQCFISYTCSVWYMYPNVFISYTCSVWYSCISMFHQLLLVVFETDISMFHQFILVVFWYSCVIKLVVFHIDISWISCSKHYNVSTGETCSVWYTWISNTHKLYTCSVLIFMNIKISYTCSVLIFMYDSMFHQWYL